MNIDASFYLMNVKSVTIERVPDKGLLRIKIKGEQGGYGDDVSLTLWGDILKDAMPEIIDTVSDESPKFPSQSQSEESAHEV